MQFRAAAEADIEIILTQRREMFREMGGEYERSIPLYEDASRSYFSKALREGSYYGIFGMLEGEVVAGGGVLMADWPGSPLNFDARRAWILNIYVAPAFRRRGFARAVIVELMAWCRGAGFQSVALHASEEGRSLYEKLGFTATNEMRLRLL